MDRLKAEVTGAEREAEQTPDDEALPLEHVGDGEQMDDPVDDASADSFPASDPPSFTGSTANRDRRDQGEG